MITITPVDETFFKVSIDDFGVEQEFSDFFTFMAPGHKFSPAYRNGTWSGQIRLFNQRNKQIYKGLLDIIIRFAKNGDYDLKIDPSLYPKDREVTKESLIEFCDNLKVANEGEPISVRDYQIEALYQSLSNYRKILISPTGSGKSLIIYAAIRYILDRNPDERIMLIVPSTGLVEQMFKDFCEYSVLNEWRPEEHIQLLYSGKEKTFTKPIMISTWQSLHAMKKSDPRTFKEVTDATNSAIFDECLHPDTYVHTSTGLVKIKNIEVGDLVKTLNEKTFEEEFKPVLKIHHNVSCSEKKFKLKTKSGEIFVTGNHKIYTNKGWKRVDELKKGDMVLNAN